MTGRDAVRDRIATGQATFRRTAHQLGQSLVSIEGDRAHATTYVTAWHEWCDGRQEALGCGTSTSSDAKMAHG